MLENKGIKRPPIGMSDFRMVRNNNKYYVDKTMYIPQLEKISNFLFLIRPRRFGKSIFLSMIADYYDCENKELNQEFEGTWISEHPQPLKGQFQILQYDFSQVLGQTNHLEDDFNTYCCGQLDMFIQKYGKYYSAETVKWALDAKTSKDKINLLSAEAKERGYHLYLIIDEYDNFTNTVLNEQGEDVYHNMTHSSGFYRSAFKIFKPNFERILFMGVSPITLNDLTSGFNIATNISLHPAFNMMLGFSEEDVREMIAYYQSVGLIQPGKDDKGNTIDGTARIDEIIADMKPWYDNYCFAEDRFDIDSRMFNSNMVLYYLNYFITAGKAPKEMADPSCRTDYAKLKNLVRLDRLDGDRKSVLIDIAQKGYVNATIQESFPAEETINPDNFISLLYYYGMLTIGGTDLDGIHLVIPNNTIRKLYYDFLLEQYQSEHWIDLTKLGAMFRNAASAGEWEPLFKHLAEQYYNDSGIRDGIQGERNIQGYFNAYLHISKLFIVHPEVEVSHGYCDFFLLADTKKYPTLQHSYILELKYLKKGATDAEVTKVIEQAQQQLLHYISDETVIRQASGTQLHGIYMVFVGGKIKDMGQLLNNSVTKLETSNNIW